MNLTLKTASGNTDPAPAKSGARILTPENIPKATQDAAFLVRLFCVDLSVYGGTGGANFCWAGLSLGCASGENSACTATIRDSHPLVVVLLKSSKESNYD